MGVANIMIAKTAQIARLREAIATSANEDIIELCRDAGVERILYELDKRTRVLIAEALAAKPMPASVPFPPMQCYRCGLTHAGICSQLIETDTMSDAETVPMTVWYGIRDRVMPDAEPNVLVVTGLCLPLHSMSERPERWPVKCINRINDSLQISEVDWQTPWVTVQGLIGWCYPDTKIVLVPKGK